MNPQKYFLFVLLFFISCSNIYSNVVKEAVKEIPEEDGGYNAYFCSVENCDKVIAELLENASESIDCAFYSLNNKVVIDALKLKKNETDVRVVIEGDNYKRQIEGEGIKIARRDGWGIMHNKFCVVDSKKVMTGSHNPTTASNNYDNNLIVISSETIASNYEDEFEELWGGKFGYGDNVEHPAVYLGVNRVENYFCPEDDCGSKIVKLISDAEESVYFMAYSFTDENVADALLFNDRIMVKGVVEKQQASSQYSQFSRLRDFGVDVKVDKNKFLMHHKVFVIDKKIVVTGSANPTESGYGRNDENILIFYDKELALKFVEEFERVYG